MNDTDRSSCLAAASVHRHAGSSRRRLVGLAVAAVLGATGAGCAAAESADAFGPGSGVGVGQGGAQDFGQFRSILDAGGLPGPGTLDDVGFFAEHHIEAPPPDCGAEVCMHGRMGVMGNLINGANCTMLVLGMNTPVDPEALERFPLHLTVVVDTSGSMAGDKIAYVREGLRRMLPVLTPEDRVSIVGFGSSAEVLVEAAGGDSAELSNAIAGLDARGSTDLYGGLRVGYEVAATHAGAQQQDRVLLLSDGEATTGLDNDAKLLALATAYGQQSIGLTTVGLGDGFEPTLMRQLAERGAGAFYFVEQDAAVAEVFEQEATSFLVPLAEDVHVDVDVAEGYRLRAIYGTKVFETVGNRATIDIPVLQIAGRTSDDDMAEGRRGGGGAIIIEVLPSGAAPANPWRVGTVHIDYRVPGTDDRVEQTVEIDSPLSPGELEPGGYFDDAAVQKSFVMLNLYAGFYMAAESAERGDLRSAIGVLASLGSGVDGWLTTDAGQNDADITDDLVYVRRFIDNLRDHGGDDPPPSQVLPNPWPMD